MEQLDAQASAPAMELPNCMAASCAEPARTQLEERRLCPQHFVDDSMREIEARQRQLQAGLWQSGGVESFKNFLSSCSSQARELLDAQQDIVSPAKDRLLDLLLLVSHLNQRLRRSPRSAASVLVWLRREDPGQTWEEETCTSSVSLHGAGLICRHRVEPGQIVFLCRKDKGGRARARIVYSHYDAAGDRQIGLEILDRDDFWNASELSRANENPPVSEPAASSASVLSCSAAVLADVEIESGAQIIRCNQLSFEVVTQGDEMRLSGIVPAGSGFAPTSAESSAASGKNQAPIRIAITWKKPR